MSHKNKQPVEVPIVHGYDPRVVDPFQEETKPPEFESQEAANNYQVIDSFKKVATPTSQEQKFQAVLATKVSAFLTLGNKIYDEVMSGLSTETLDDLRDTAWLKAQHVGQIGEVDVAIKSPNFPEMALELQLRYGESGVKLHPATFPEGSKKAGMYVHFESERPGTDKMMVSGIETPKKINTMVHAGGGIRRLGDQIVVFGEANEQLAALDQALHTDVQGQIAISGIKARLDAE